MADSFGPYRIQVRAWAEHINVLQHMLTGFKNHTALFLSLKLSFWLKPPYVFAGMGHWDRQTARRCAAAGRAAFDQHPHFQAHHRQCFISQRLACDSTLTRAMGNSKFGVRAIGCPDSKFGGGNGGHRYVFEGPSQ